MRGFRIAASLAVLTSAALACNAIVGVEDVTLKSSKDSGVVGSDDADIPIETPDSPTPVPEAKVLLALGYNHSCARNAAGKVLCWGDNSVKQLGDALDGGPATGPVPQEVKNVSDVSAIASGLNHTCAVKKTGGTVMCWGSNLFGQLGFGSDTPSSQSTPVAVVGVSNAIAVSGGTSFSCALVDGGTMMCWGANYSSQLGDGTTTDRPTPIAVPGITKATGIATGEYHACAIVGGAVRCWGDNLDGQLGNGTTTAVTTPPTSGGILSDVVQVVAASSFTCARQGSGKVYCWGANKKGELGTGSANPAPNPSPVLTNVNDAVNIWVGYEHACAARKTGAVVCWGAAGLGETGSGPTDPDASLPNPTAVAGLTGALAVSTGGSHSCATNTDGRVYCWGASSLGQVGNGTTQTAFTAVQIGSFP